MDSQGGVLDSSADKGRVSHGGETQQRRKRHSLDLGYIVNRLTMTDQEQSHRTGVKDKGGPKKAEFLANQSALGPRFAKLAVSSRACYLTLRYSLVRTVTPIPLCQLQYDVSKLSLHCFIGGKWRLSKPFGNAKPGVLARG